MLNWGLEEVQRAIQMAETTYSSIIRAAYKEKLRVVNELAQELNQLYALVEKYCNGEISGLQVDQLRMTCGTAELQSRLQLISYSTSLEEVTTHLQCAFLYRANHSLFEPAAQATGWTDLQLAYVPYFGFLMKHFIIATGELVTMPDSFRVLKDCSIWLPVSETEVLLTGEKASLHTYLCDVSQETYSLTQNTTFHHLLGGLGLYRNCVYVFGGTWKETAQRFCECFDLMTRRWSVLPCMQFPRSSFIPAREDNKFYLLGGRWTSTAEVFDCESGGFRTLNVELNASDRCLASVYDKDVVVLLRGEKYVWEKSTQSEGLSPLGSWGNFTLLMEVPPVRNGDCLYIVGGTSLGIFLYCLELPTKQITWL